MSAPASAHGTLGMSGYGPGTAVATLAAVLFAVGAVLQHEAASASGSGKGPDLRQLITRPAWLAGQSATATGTLLQVLALGLAPVAIVQPLLAAGLVVALGMRAVRTRCVPTPTEVVGAVLTVGGLAVFLIAAKPRRGAPHHLPHPVAVIGIAVVAVLLVLGTARLKRGVAGALACGCAGGIAAGVAAVLISIALRILHTQGLVHVLSSSALWGALVVAIVAQLGAQQAYARGSLSWSMPALVLLDPLAAIPAARFLLGERLEPGHAVVWAPAGLVAAIGVVLLSRSGEDCRRPFRIRRPAAAPDARLPTHGDRNTDEN